MQYIDGQTFLKMLCSASEALEKEKTTLNKLNVFPIPDGDTGNNMSLTLSSLKNLKTNDNHLGRVSKLVAKEMLMNSRGNSGTILASFFLGVAKAQADKEKISVDEMIEAFKVGQKSSYKMIMSPQEGTILTLMREASNIDTKNIDSFEELFDKLTKNSQDNLQKTPDLLPILKQAGVVDSGSYGFVVIMKAMRDYLENNEYHTLENDVEVPTFKMELVLEKSNEFIGEDKLVGLKDELSKYGTELNVVENNKLVNVSLVSEDNEKVIETLEKYGRVLNYDVFSVNKVVAPRDKDVALVSVAVGDGNVLMMKDLGFDEVIDGRHTLNVSYQALKEACDKTNAKTVFVFPNNKDTIPTATLLANTVTEYKIIVVETISMVEAYYLANIFDREESVDENDLLMRKAINKISSLAISKAAKDSTIGKLDIKKDDYLVLLKGKITAAFKTKAECFEYIANLLLQYSVVSIYYGKDVNEDEANEYVEQLNEIFDYDIDVMCFYGGQNIYEYLILGE